MTSLLSSRDSPHTWSKAGFVQEEGNPVLRNEGVPLRKSLTAEDFAKQPRVIHKQLVLIAFQSEHPGQLIISAHTETKISIRKIIGIPPPNSLKFRQAVRILVYLLILSLGLSQIPFRYVIGLFPNPPSLRL